LSIYLLDEASQNGLIKLEIFSVEGLGWAWPNFQFQFPMLSRGASALRRLKIPYRRISHPQ